MLTLNQRSVLGVDWTSDGGSLVFSSGEMGNSNLWMVHVSGGTPERLVGGENAEDVGSSRTGNQLAYTHALFDSNIWRVPGPNSVHKNSPPTRFIASTKLEYQPQFSPDGKRIVFVSGRSGKNVLWLCDTDGLNLLQLTSGGRDEAPRWSPDNRSIAFTSTKAGNYDVCVISIDGGPVRCLTAGPSDNVLPSWSKDGRWIYFGSRRSGNWQIWKVPAQGGTAVQVTKHGGSEASESFNGDFVYYAKPESPGIWKVPVAGGDEVQILDQGGSWALNDEGIFIRINEATIASTGVVSPNQRAPAIKFYNFATGQLSVIREFSKDTKMIFGFSVSPDGEWILYTQVDQSGSDLMLMENYR
jgi:Tol biopolymer transport system component